jgi:hypothetical protein
VARLYFDNDVSLRLAPQLANAGHVVTTAVDRGLTAAGDEVQLLTAVRLAPASRVAKFYWVNVDYIQGVIGPLFNPSNDSRGKTECLMIALGMSIHLLPVEKETIGSIVRPGPHMSEP